MPLQQTSGNVTADAYGGGAAAVPNYIEQVFQTYLYTGNGSTQTITNGIDLAGKGGLVWIKGRSGSFGTGYHLLQDSARGFGNSTALSSNATDAQYSSTGIIQSVSSTGFTSGASGLSNASSTDYASWTFRKQPKFFDVVTGTADSSGNVSFSHSLGAAPGFVIIKSTTNASQWFCYHQSLGTSYSILLNTTGAAVNQGAGFVTSTSTTFSMNTGFGAGAVGYVAYLFAHNAGGFGLTGTDNVISCGSYSGNSGTNNITLGYEPQWVLIKAASGSSAAGNDWLLMDTMRGLPGVTGVDAKRLFPNASFAENGASTCRVTATGFQVSSAADEINNSNNTYIYIAIRRGPMKVPTDGTKVFTPITKTGDAPTASYSEIGFPFDTVFNSAVAGTYGGSASYSNFMSSRLTGFGTGSSPALQTSSTAAEATVGQTQWNGTTFSVGATWVVTKFAWYFWERAPNFFDEVCYTGTGTVGATQTHNLGVAPELIIFKSRSNATNWPTCFNITGSNYQQAVLNTTAAAAQFLYSDNIVLSAAPTSTQITLADGTSYNGSGRTFVAYLFASCPGVSKVGSYTGNGTTQTIDCGFTGGARFVLIKRTDSTGDWYVYDTARGMTTLTDPYLLLDSTAAESATLGSVTSVTGGFALNASILAAINTNAASYIFFAVA